MGEDLATKNGEKTERGRDEQGRFLPGNQFAVGGNGGRPRNAFRNRINRRIKGPGWNEIIDAAIEQAKQGDRHARQYLTEYAIGKPEESVEHQVEGGMTIIVQRNTPRPGDTT